MRTFLTLFTLALTASLLAVPTAMATISSSDTSFAVAGCFGDPEGDTFDASNGSRVAAPQTDITLFCVDYRTDSIDVSLTIPAGTSPNTDPQWNGFGAGMALDYTAADGSDRQIQLSTQQQNGVFEYLVLRLGNPNELLCSGAATVVNQAYGASIPTSCLQAPPTIELTALARYADSLDVAPFNGGRVSVPQQTPTGAERVTRFAGAGRQQTAILSSQAAFPNGGAGAVVVAFEGNFPDAVVAAPLAAARNAPLLLSPQTGATQIVRDEATRALGGPGDVILVGGPVALSEQVRADFEVDGHTVERVAGDSRFTTAIEIANATNPSPSLIMIADGGDFPDALIAGGNAPLFGGVAVLVDANGIPQAVTDYLNAHPDAPRVAIGPVALQVFQGDDSVQAISGLSPAHTSAIVMDSLLGPTDVVVATYEAFPDGLSGGAFAARAGRPLVLSARDAVPGELLDQMEADGPFASITLMGGTAALSDTVAGQLASFLG